MHCACAVLYTTFTRIFICVQLHVTDHMISCHGDVSIQGPQLYNFDSVVSGNWHRVHIIWASDQQSMQHYP